MGIKENNKIIDWTNHLLLENQYSSNKHLVLGGKDREQKKDDLCISIDYGADAKTCNPNETV